MRLGLAALAVLVLAGAALGQTPPPRIPKYALSPRPNPLTPWKAPNRPHWKVAELVAAHAGQPSWAQTLVQDAHFTGRYIQMAPGEKTKTLFYPDTTMFWIVQSGRMRVSIAGLEPFEAGKSMIVQVPARTPFHVETLGDAPVLRFEVVHTGALPVYAEGEKPDPVKGQKYVRIAYAAPPPPPLDPAKVYLDFDKDIVQGNGRAGRFLKDGSLIRGKSIPTPPRDDLGHWHVDASEFWFIMEGQLDFQLEGAEPFIAEQGDVVYAPYGRFHSNSFSGDGMATRLAIFPAGNLNNLDADNPSRQAP
jgi:mannose-6-phosphate isomerase-like protein (cupin superfamily)